MASPSVRPLAHALDPVEHWTALDRVAAVVRRAVGPLTRARSARNALAGVPLGHPVHPPLAQFTLGCFLSAGLLDLRGRPEDRSASTGLIALGVAGAVPTALTGLGDWSHGHEEQQRTGLVHAAANGSALVLYAATLLGRRSGRTARWSSLAAAGLTGAAAYVGGHLAFRQALGANHTEHVPHRVPPGWTSLGSVELIPERALVARTLGDQPLLCYRDGDDVTVLSDVCPHLSAPLHEGEVSDGCVTCPWHGSTFRLADGEPVAGPATAPVPAFEVRVEGGEVQVLLPGAG